MAALTEGRNTREIDGKMMELPVAAKTTIYEGSLVVLDGGLAKPGKKAEGLIAAGRAERMVDNSAGGDGDVTITVRRGVFLFDNSSGAGEIKAGNILGDCYIADDQTVTAADSGASVAGKVVGIYDEGVAVEIK